MKNLKMKLSTLLLASVVSFSLFAGNGGPEAKDLVPEVYQADFDAFVQVFDATIESEARLEIIKAKFEKMSSESDDCFQDAWDFGTTVSNTFTFIDAEQQSYYTWSATNWYYEKYCL